jgi:UDP-N-acetylmuramate dehydrogenase
MMPDNGAAVLLHERFPGASREVRLRDLTTWRIGGPALSVTVTGQGMLSDLLGLLQGAGIRWSVLGRGSNILADDAGTDLVLVLLAGELAVSRWELRDGSWDLRCGGGVRLPSLSGAACTRGAAGLAFAAGIPGTVGGAIFMNAGAYGGTISDCLAVIRVTDGGGHTREMTRQDCCFSYRNSLFQGGGLVVSGAHFRLSEGDPRMLRAEAGSILAIRREKLPLDLPSAGSVFRRPAGGDPPGKLIEDSGLKGRSVGGAMVSHRHANFIVNTGGASSADVSALVDVVKGEVLVRTGVLLEEEIRYLGRGE